MTDRIVFRRPAGDLWAGWAGDWPPPGRLTLVLAAGVGLIAVDPDDPKLSTESAAQLMALAQQTEAYRLETASKVDEPAPADAHWFRGAVYIPAVPS